MISLNQVKNPVLNRFFFLISGGVGSLLLCAGFSLVASWGYSLVAKRRLWDTQASVVAAPGL